MTIRIRHARLPSWPIVSAFPRLTKGIGNVFVVVSGHGKKTTLPKSWKLRTASPGRGDTFIPSAKSGRQFAT